MTLTEEINRLKKEKDAVILAHYYAEPEVQEVADYVGDSFYLSRVAVGLAEQTIVFCGVSFMGESAKILNPGKTVLMPDLRADCPMAHMADAGTIRRMREKYEDLAVVCYINSTAELKKYSDICVTSANAVEIVKALPNRNIFFIPDKNLAHYVAEQVPEKHFVFNEGYCPVHDELQLRELAEAKAMHPDAEVLSHPECREEVLKQSDYIGCTSGIIQYAARACGLPRAQALEFAAQMVLGSARLLLESGKHPGELKDAVCSPGGTTIQGVRKLEEAGFRGAVMNAVIAACEKGGNIK